MSDTENTERKKQSIKVSWGDNTSAQVSPGIHYNFSKKLLNIQIKSKRMEKTPRKHQYFQTKYIAEHGMLSGTKRDT